MKEIKSVRVRKVNIKSGALDIKVTIYEDKHIFGANEYVLIGTSNGSIIWPETKYKIKGVSDPDFFISQFIYTNNVNNNLISSNTYYNIIQDPWKEQVPIIRDYGSDPYYLNNGAEVYIDWMDTDIMSSTGGEYFSKEDGTEITYNPSIYRETGVVKIVNITKSIRIIHKEETRNITINKNYEFEYGYDSNEFRGTDLIILDDLISKWKRKIPNYDTLELCSPNNESCSIIPYKSPLKPIEPEPEPVPIVPVNETPKEPIIVVLPESVKVKIDTEIKVFIGKNKEVVEIQSVLQEDEMTDLSDEYTEEGFVGKEETPFDLMQDSEILRDDNSSPPPPDGGGSTTGGSQVNSPGGSVSKTEVVLPKDLSKVRNSSVIKTQSMGSGSSRGINNDIKSPKGDVVLGSDITKSMNEFVIDVIGPFATFLKTKYPSLYSSWQITSATRGYVPPGGSLTSQHMKGEAIDSQIVGANANNPGKNIELLNAILEWYKTNKVGYGQILFETRGNSCWIHWSYKRGNTKLSLLRFEQDKTLRTASINTTGKYVLPPVNASQLGFSNYA